MQFRGSASRGPSGGPRAPGCPRVIAANLERAPSSAVLAPHAPCPTCLFLAQEGAEFRITVVSLHPPASASVQKCRSETNNEPRRPTTHTGTIRNATRSPNVRLAPLNMHTEKALQAQGSRRRGRFPQAPLPHCNILGAHEALAVFASS